MMLRLELMIKNVEGRHHYRPALLSGCVVVECVIEIDLGDAEKAAGVYRSTVLDNGRFVDAEVHGTVLRLKASAPSPASMLHTLEDLLACLRVADRVLVGDSELDPVADLDG